MKALIVAGFEPIFPNSNNNEEFELIVGVDRGALFAAEQDLHLTLAIGDFDSVSADELARIHQVTDRLVQLPREKDETDLEVALQQVIADFPSAEVTIVGALGGRLDHALTNIFLPTTEKFATRAAQISFQDRQNTVNYLLPGKQELFRTDRKYIGFLQVATGRSLTIEGAKYPLAAADNWSDIYASNEFLSDRMTVSFEQGLVIVLRSVDA